ncbi:MAG: 1,4-dihydroxy-6-naphthoate synthase [bacterium]
MKLSVAYSPCPNDTFTFYGLATGRIELPVDCFGGSLEIETRLHDVETLNRMALDGVCDVTKLSFHAWLQVRDSYQLLRVGATLGRGCGPLVVARALPGGPRPPLGRIAVPGEHTTAHLLFRLWAPDSRNLVFVPYDRIMGMVANGEVDAGVIIHEGRFVYRQRGLACLVDLGDWWEAQTGLPIPLGCIAARKTLGEACIAGCEEMIEQSLRLALRNPSAPQDYIKQHAQELDDEVIRQHIATYVNEFSLDLGATGRAAVAALESLAREEGGGQ